MGYGLIRMENIPEVPVELLEKQIDEYVELKREISSLPRKQYNQRIIDFKEKCENEIEQETD